MKPAMSEVVRMSLDKSKAFLKESFGAMLTITTICGLIVLVYLLGLYEDYNSQKIKKRLGKLISYRILERMMGYSYEEIDYNKFFNVSKP